MLVALAQIRFGAMGAACAVASFQTKPSDVDVLVCQLEVRVDNDLYIRLVYDLALGLSRAELQQVVPVRWRHFERLCIFAVFSVSQFRVRDEISSGFILLIHNPRKGNVNTLSTVFRQYWLSQIHLCR